MSTSASGDDSAPAEPAPRGRLVRVLALYTLLRFALTAAIAALLALVVPLVFALMIAVVLQLPLSWLLFGRQRAQVNALVGAATAHRRGERDRLRAALHGESDEGPETPPAG